jgi:uncharacterized protein (DUF433 family)
MDIQKVLSDRRIIYFDPDIMSGTPVFVGTRVPLQTFSTIWKVKQVSQNF